MRSPPDKTREPHELGCRRLPRVSRTEKKPAGRLDVSCPTEVGQLSSQFVGLVHHLHHVVLVTIVESSYVSVRLIPEDIGILEVRLRDVWITVVVDEKHAATRREARPHHRPEGCAPLTRNVGQPKREEDYVVPTLWHPGEEVGQYVFDVSSSRSYAVDFEHLRRGVDNGQMIGGLCESLRPPPRATRQLQDVATH